MHENRRSAAPGTAIRIEALGFRSLRYVSQSLESFQVLVGPNASGKSTFLDVLAFLGDLVRAGLEPSVLGEPRLGIPLRAPDPKHLTWLREQPRFELAVEFAIPEERRRQLKGGQGVCRYELAFDVTGPARIVVENLWLKPVESEPKQPVQRSLFPNQLEIVESVVHLPRKQTPKGWKKVVSRGEESERVMFSSETSGWNNPFRLAADKTALSGLPEDEEKFPVATWLRRQLTDGVQRIALSSEDMRRPSPPGRHRAYLPDGSNLPHVVHELELEHPDRFRDWLGHVQEALPDLEGIRTHEREEDRHRYLMLRYRNGLEAPSWLVSDGTLRLLALTLLAYIPDLSGLYLIEEPENGIHPRALEIVFQSLSSVYGAQVLLATHSPMMLSLAELDQVLCFDRTEDGATDVIQGSEHPRLREWKGSTDLGTLLAAGVLG